MTDQRTILACDLGALTVEERTRVWMKLGGGPGVKEFLGAAGLHASSSRAGT